MLHSILIYVDLQNTDWLLKQEIVGTSTYIPEENMVSLYKKS